MTKNDDRVTRVTAQRTGRIIRAMRRQMGRTQIDTAKLLGVSQGGLSKLEAAILVPTAPVWIRFCEISGTPPMSLQTGFVDHLTDVELRSGPVENGFELPLRYRNFKGSKVRTAFPFLAFLEKMAGKKELKDFLKLCGLDPDFFVVLDNQINVNFAMDVLKLAIQKSWLTQDNLDELVLPIALPEAHGNLGAGYAAENNVNGLLTNLLSNSKKYEANFNYRIEDSSQYHMDLAVMPERHMKDFHYKDDPVLGDVLCRFKKAYFQKFTTYKGDTPWHLEEKECAYQGGSKCVYHLTFDSFDTNASKV